MLSEELGVGFTLADTEREEHRTPAGAVQAFLWTVLHRSAEGVARS